MDGAFGLRYVGHVYADGKLTMANANFACPEGMWLWYNKGEEEMMRFTERLHDNR